ncbi:class A beta-lactamase-related serine hydrolase [Pseudomonas syringae pv. pisi str. PP1]|uniref:serine hydrolase domain-containing protein n=1 Tax=Pseudomonas syringae TaxID=317 RepID=UPI000423A7E0|nr:serine hydrolase domain-containing protein [Pseudomonas syringae]AZG85516.1 class A beta-lactamase-related serine hydrolase [Pseudomonas syringae pv. pisi str. PP1]PBP51272.1 alkaline D-peptidase [Pseudomonas syringae]RMM18609.1 Beta-lactamase, s C [Pseudomonas syringae pv. pisi]UZS63934.1 beta-lactamase family protein [Pseudomonas syringae]
MSVFESKHQNPGFVSLLCFDQGGCHERRIGVESIATQRPLSRDTVFDLASVSKQFTAFCLLLLEQKGFLALSDPIGRFVPEISGYSSQVSLQDLVYHIGGMPDFIEIALSQGIDFSDELGAVEILALLKEQTKSDFPAGERFEYSNTGYFLLGIAIERVSGLCFSDFAKIHIFAPLAMEHTFILDGLSRDSRVASGYARGEGQTYALSRSPWNSLGASLVHSSAADLMKWGENFLTAKVGGHAVIEKMLTPLSPVNDRGEAIIEHSSYCFGISMEKDGRGVKFCHEGVTAGFSSYFVRSLEKGYTIAVLSNVEDYEVEQLATDLCAEHGL